MADTQIRISDRELTILRAALDEAITAWRTEADRLANSRWDDVRGLNSRRFEQLRHQAAVADKLLERLL